MSWRGRLIVLHRDVGLICVGLTVVYAVSGIAVNHRHHWDYNYSSRVTKRIVGSPAQLLARDARQGGSPGELARAEQDALVRRLLAALPRGERPAKVFWRGPDRLSLFFGAGGRDIVDYLPSTGVVEHTIVEDRPLLRQLNFLHLNEGRGLWPFVADLYALALLFLAVSGATMIKRRGLLSRRGGLFVAAGVVLPLVAYLLLRR